MRFFLILAFIAHGSLVFADVDSPTREEFNRLLSSVQLLKSSLQTLQSDHSKLKNDFSVATTQAANRITTLEKLNSDLTLALKDLSNKTLKNRSFSNVCVVNSMKWTDLKDQTSTPYSTFRIPYFVSGSDCPN